MTQTDGGVVERARKRRYFPEDLLGASSLRLAIVRKVIECGEVTALDLMSDLGLTRNGVGKHLGELTEAGFLIERRATHPRGTGGVIYWSADLPRIHRAWWELGSSLFGYDESAESGRAR